MINKWSDPVGERYYENLHSLVEAMNSKISKICAAEHLKLDQTHRDRNALAEIVDACNTGGKFL